MERRRICRASAELANPQRKPIIRPAWNGFQLTQNTLKEAVGPRAPPAIPEDKDFQKAIADRYKLTANGGQTGGINTLSLFGPETDKFFFEQLLGVPGWDTAQQFIPVANSRASTEPTFTLTMESLANPVDGPPALAPVEDIVKAEKEYLDMMVEKTGLEGKRDWTLGASLKPKIDSDIPYLAGVINFGLKIPTNANLVAMKKERLRFDTAKRTADRKKFNLDVTAAFDNSGTDVTGALVQAANHWREIGRLSKNVVVLVGTSKLPVTDSGAVDDFIGTRIQGYELMEQLLLASKNQADQLKMIKSAVDDVNSSLANYYGEVMAPYIAKTPSDDEPTTPSQPRRDFLKIFKQRLHLPHLGTSKQEHPGLMMGKIKHKKVNDYIKGRFDFNMMEEGWVDPESGEITDYKILDDFIDVFRDIHDMKVLRQVAYGLNVQTGNSPSNGDSRD